MKVTNNEYRRMIIEKLSNAKEVNWKKGWRYVGSVNATTNLPYNGLNKLMLFVESLDKGYKDNRWCTFNQARKMGWKIRKGEKSVPLQFFSPYDKKNKKKVTWGVFSTLDEEDRSIIVSSFNVFNLEQMENAPKFEQTTIEVAPAIDKIIEGMGVNVEHGMFDACYSPRLDTVYIANKDMFESEYAYHSTLLHELSHATSHESRLNRTIDTRFGSDAYSKEEFIAELSSVLCSEIVPYTPNTEDLGMHLSYLNGWSREWSNNEKLVEELFDKAFECADYIISLASKEEQTSLVA